MERKYPHLVSDGFVVALIRNDEDLARWRRSTRICAAIILIGMIVGLVIGAGWVGEIVAQGAGGG